MKVAKCRLSEWPRRTLHLEIFKSGGCPFISIPLYRVPWSKGYFEFLEHHDLGAMDRLRQHSFRDSRGFLFDEQGARLTKEVPPVGQWGLQSYRTIDDEISKALGIPLAES